jgi:hypothetical protein
MSIAAIKPLHSRGFPSTEARVQTKDARWQRSTDAATGVDLDVGKTAVALIEPLPGSTVRANSGAAVAYCGRLYRYR